MILRASHAGSKPVEGTDNLVDAHLISKCQAGDADAFQRLFRACRNDVIRLAHRMLGHTEDLEDVVQEVFLQVYRSLAGFRGQARFSTWLYRVTVNVVLMHRRAARSRPMLVPSVEEPGLQDLDALPDEQMLLRGRVAAFQRVLNRLSEKKRTAFILHELEGLAPTEIAAVVGAPVLTVRTRLFYARRELMDLLRDDPELAALTKELEATSGDGALTPARAGRS